MKSKAVLPAPNHRASAFESGKGASEKAVQMAVHKDGTTLDGHTTSVDWETAKLGGSDVGVEMTASPLGPDHIQGGPPAYGEQSSLMNKLNTDPDSLGPDKYIRGHLLNDNLGGEGLAYNLFPITANANKKHHDKIEKQVKKWVNTDKQWVKYSVKVQNISSDLSNKKLDKNYVNSDFVCKAAVLDPTDMSTVVKSVSVTIPSEYKQYHNPKEKFKNQDALLPPKGNEADAFSPRLTTAKNDEIVKFNDLLFDKIRHLYSFAYLDDAKDLFDNIDKIAGIGDGSVAAYKELITEAMQSGNLFDDSIPSGIKGIVTRINNRSEPIIEAINQYIKKVELAEDNEDSFEIGSSHSDSSDDDDEEQILSVDVQLEKIADPDEPWLESDWYNLKHTFYGANKTDAKKIITEVDIHLLGSPFYQAYMETFLFVMKNK